MGQWGSAGEVVPDLVSVATEADAARVLAEHDPHRVASAVLGEVASRAALLSPPPEPTTVQFELHVDGHCLEFLLTSGASGLTVEPGRVPQPWVRVGQDLAELLLAVFAPTAGHDASRTVAVRDEPGPSGPAPDDPWLRQWSAAQRTAGLIVRACAPDQADLSALALRFGSDKWGGHWYTPHYERHLAAYRQQAVRILEIGVGGYDSSRLGGASLRMWKHYFPRGLIYGLDIADKSAVDEARVQTVQGDQSDPEFLAKLAEQIGPLDIVIDDGSHRSDHIITSFTTLFPRLRRGGCYVIEDLHTSYWPDWNGDRTDLNDPHTTMGFVKTLMDELHRPERVDAAPALPHAAGVTAIHLYHNIVFVEKGVDHEQPGPTWLRGQ